MTSLPDRIRAGDPDALDDADVIEWCMDDPIGRALVDRVRTLEAENVRLRDELGSKMDQVAVHYGGVIELLRAENARLTTALTAANEWIDTAVCGDCGQPVARLATRDDQ